MSTLSALLGEQTDLGPDVAQHLQALVGDWQIIADLGLADLLLWVRTIEGCLLCVAHVRPATAPTARPTHQVGRSVAAGEMSAIDRAFTAGEPEEPAVARVDPTPTGSEAVPVRQAGRIVAVLGRDHQGGSPRSAVEAAYLGVASDLLSMVAAGGFPGTGKSTSEPLGPRVGDGFLRLDATGIVRYASPNGVSALRRMGLTADLVGRELAEVSRGLVDSAGGDPDRGEVGRLRSALVSDVGQSGELATRSGTVTYRTIPLSAPAAPGTIVFLHDVTDLRQRDLAIRSQDVSIREVHHRVKNNLQTVAALLRLQGRRMNHPAARAALAESVRRVSSIALVHETLAASRDGAADLDEILDALVPMISEVSAARPGVRFEREGLLGELSAELATPLVMALTELLHNAVEHGLAGGEHGRVVIAAQRSSNSLTVRIRDDGIGLPQGFSLEASDSLGLQIVRTLVESELRGSIRLTRLRDRHAPGTEAVLTVPLPR